MCPASLRTGTAQVCVDCTHARLRASHLRLSVAREGERLARTTGGRLVRGSGVHLRPGEPALVVRGPRLRARVRKAAEALAVVANGSPGATALLGRLERELRPSTAHTHTHVSTLYHSPPALFSARIPRPGGCQARPHQANAAEARAMAPCSRKRCEASASDAKREHALPSTHHRCLLQTPLARMPADTPTTCMPTSARQAH